ncbi:MAG: DUF4433 domain-containing protein [Chitinophagales bacterium]|nr:DUF4433 domain-containing protein [Chitinophagales bacterium]
MLLKKEENFISLLSCIISSFEKIDVILRDILQSDKTSETNAFISIFEELFNDPRFKGHFDFKVSLIGKSSYYNYLGPRNEENSNKHLTLNLKSEEIIFYDHLYDYKISDLLKFFKHLFSLIENFSIFNNSVKIAKFQNLLTEIKRDFVFWELLHQKSLDLANNQKELLNAFSFLAQSTAKKINWQDYLKVIADNNIIHLYHFTDLSNIESIKKYGGLYSWFYCDKNNVCISKPGGNLVSREFDKRKNLENFVRLSFCENHPMLFVAKNDGRISNPIILKCDTEIILYKNTLFSNCNANKTEAIINESFELFRNLRFDIFKKKYFDINKDNTLKSYYQAEVLVAEHLPIKYILNINDV